MHQKNFYKISLMESHDLTQESCIVSSLKVEVTMLSTIHNNLKNCATLGKHSNKNKKIIQRPKSNIKLI